MVDTVAKVNKSGKSLTLTIPNNYAKFLKLKHNDLVKMNLEKIENEED